jgi:hypothetical protein
MSPAATLLAAMVLIASLAGTARGEVPAEQQTLIALRILAYDYTLARRAGGTVRIGIVHGEGAPSTACRTRMRGAVKAVVGRVVVSGMQIDVAALEAAQISGEELTRRKISVLYVCRGVDASVAQIVRAARAAHALTVTDQLDYLERGVSIALTKDAARVGISINLAAAGAEGTKFNSQFLRQTKVVKR